LLDAGAHGVGAAAAGGQVRTAKELGIQAVAALDQLLEGAFSGGLGLDQIDLGAGAGDGDPVVGKGLEGVGKIEPFGAAFGGVGLAVNARQAEAAGVEHPVAQGEMLGAVGDRTGAEQAIADGHQPAGGIHDLAGGVEFVGQIFEPAVAGGEEPHGRVRTLIESSPRGY
jgi:hypothetical protein